MVRGRPRRTSWRGGNVAIEAALVLPVLIGLLVLTADVIRYLDSAARVERAAAAAADLGARNETLIDHVDFQAPIANNDLAMVFLAANETAYPDDLAARGRVYLSAVIVDAGTGGRLLWQRTGPYGLAAESRLDPTALPPLPTGSTFIVAEVIYDFRPLLIDADLLDRLVPRFLYRRAVFRPRLTALTTLEPGNG